MTITLVATYENGVLRLSQRLDLPDHTQVQVHIETMGPGAEETNVLQHLLALATDLGVTDLAEQHDHYLYGMDKR